MDFFFLLSFATFDIFVTSTFRDLSFFTFWGVNRHSVLCTVVVFLKPVSGLADMVLIWTDFNLEPQFYCSLPKDARILITLGVRDTQKFRIPKNILEASVVIMWPRNHVVVRVFCIRCFWVSQFLTLLIAQDLDILQGAGRFTVVHHAGQIWTIHLDNQWYRYVCYFFLSVKVNYYRSK